MRRTLLALLFLAPAVAVAQRPVAGVVFDSLLNAPLAGAQVWVRGGAVGGRAQTDSSGRFTLDSLPPGRYTLLVSHPGLDSSGLYTLAHPITVRAGDTAGVVVATPSLATLWRRRCGQDLMERSDSGLVFGVVQDVASQAHLAGAGVLVQWLRIVQTDRVNVQTVTRSQSARTDSTGTYYVCGVSREMKLALRAYAQSDSSGLIDLLLSKRRVGRQDLTIALAPKRRPAALRGSAMTTEQTPLFGGRVSVREGPSTMIGADGGFMLRNIPPGTQWVTVHAIGRAPFEQAVDLRPGDTTWLAASLGLLPITLNPVKVEGKPAPAILEFEERRRIGLGYARGEAELAQMGTLRGVFTTMPSARITRGAGLTDFVVMLPSPSLAGRAYCQATLYIDGVQADYEQLNDYRPSDLVGVEMYPRAASAPIKYQSPGNTCGVVLVWTKQLKP